MIIDIKTARDIDKKVDAIIRDMSIKEPPLDISEVLEHLKICKNYYNLEEPTFLEEIRHRIQIGSKNISSLIGKISLMGLCLPEEKKILIDCKTPNTKEKWVTAHEIIHQMLPTHSQILGDTAETLSPEYHEMIEAEANYGASSLIFLNNCFAREMLDYPPTINSIRSLGKKYRNSFTSTFRRYIEQNTKPIAGIVHIPNWTTSPSAATERVRCFVKSPEFLNKYPNPNLGYLIEYIESVMPKKSGGVLGLASIVLTDINGNKKQFNLESFYNQYEILTLIV